MNAARTASRPVAATSILTLMVVLAACTGGAGTPSPSASDAPPSTEPGSSASGMPSQSPPEPSESAAASAAPQASGSAQAWTETHTFGAPGANSVTDVAGWDGGFIAIGHTWTQGSIHGPAEPLVWLSEDGTSWTEVDVDLGTTDVQFRGILPLTTGGAVIVGDVGAQAALDGEGTITAAAWRSTDGLTWNAFELPSEIAAQPAMVASGPIGHVISSGTELWYSADAESWQLAYEADDGVAFREPVAGDEGFVVPALDVEEDRALVLASGDGLEWFEAEPPAHLANVAPLAGDWMAWASTSDPPTISILRSSNGLEWEMVQDVNDLTGPDGPKAGQGMESDLTEAPLSGHGGMVLMSLAWNHCCAQLPVGVGSLTSTDGETWQATGLPEDAFVSAIASDGEVVVAVGYLDRGAEAAFWVTDR